MVYYIQLLAVIILLHSCNNADKTKVPDSTRAEKRNSEKTAARKTQREFIIEELKRLEAIFTSRDKEKIAEIFTFPLSDTTVSIYVDDSTFNRVYEQNGNKATRVMFLRYFSDVSANLQIDQINQLFQKLNVNDLLLKPELEHDAITKTEPCYHFYGVKIEKDIVTLTVGTNSNKDWKSTSVSDDELPENSSELCEHVLWWNFQFDGKKLHLKNISGAG